MNGNPLPSFLRPGLVLGFTFLFAFGLTLEAEASKPTVSFEASVDKDTLKRRGLLWMTVKISAFRRSYWRLRLPRHRRFRLLRKIRKRRKDVVYLSGGKVAFRYVWTYRIKLRSPWRVGTYRFTAGRVRFGRKRYKTKRFTVRVVRKAEVRQTTKSGFPAVIEPRGSTFLLPVVSPRTIRFGEQTTLSYYLFTRYNETITRSQPPPLLQFEQETLHPLQMIQSQQRIRLKGKKYRYALALRYALFPRKTGTLTVAPMSIWINRDASNARQQERIASPRVTIKVLPAPSSGRPSSWHSSWVGRFKLSSQIHVTRYALGTPIPWKQCITGVGNHRQLAFPKFVLPKGLKLLYKRRQTRLRKTNNRVQGKTCQILFLQAERPGSLELPGLHLPHFDPWRKRYQSARTPPLRLNVVGVKRLGQREAVQVKRQKASAKERSSRGNRTQESSPRLVWFVGVGCVIFLALVFGWLTRRRASRLEDDELEPSLSASKEMTLEEIQDWLSQQNQGFRRQDIRPLEQMLYRWFDSYLQQPTRGLSLKVLTERLRRQGMPSDVTEEVQSVLQQCHQLRFDPTLSPSSAAAMYDAVRRLLPKLREVK